ncbi:MAG: DUF2726 domain-containing protein [Elusimicrobia bacterium]|nr:DUF2726 domain-containing protein [Elusimicrobiota bacterium]
MWHPPTAAVLLLMLAIVVSVGVLVLVKLVGPNEAFPYRRVELFSKGERAFLSVLEEAVGEKYKILGKVRLADLLNVSAEVERGSWKAAMNKIQSKHIDFVLCRKEDYSVAFAIELDDRTHERGDRRERDSFVEAACKAARLPLLRFSAQAHYDARDILGRVLETVGDS